jgi:hypothetical protein
MTVALLLLIVLILLFGAGVVKGWLANLAGVGCAAIVILAALLWLGSFFGENGPAYILYGILAAFSVLLLIGLAVRNGEDGPQTPSIVVDASTTEEQPSVPAEPDPRDRVWAWFADDITLRFTPEARAKATELYDSNDVIGLDRFCRGQRNSPYR